MDEPKQYTEEEIREMAKKFFDEHVKPMFPPNIFCEACGAENCPNNQTCIKCNCQL